MENIQRILQHQVLEATKQVESHLDNELERLDQLEVDDLKNIRAKRLKELKQQQEENKEWLAKGHGEYTELPEKEFFEKIKESPNVVLVFYKSGSPRCDIVDAHMKILCKKHLEARFLKINAEKAPFLTDRLNICVLPAICLIKDSQVVDYIIGFTDLGNCDDFSTEMMEWRIAQSKVIKYSGDLLTPPDQQKLSKRTIFQEKRKTIQQSNRGDSSDDEFLND